MAGPTLPYTGREFLESLDDGREVWIYGERVKTITTHPAFQNCARMLARLYDALHEDHASGKNVLTEPTEWGGFTHRYFRAPRTVEEQVAGRDAIAAWARLTYGWLGRSPDYKAAFLGTLGANADFYAPYQENARRWYRFSQERVPFINHAIIHPPVDRNIAPGAPGGPNDIYARVTKETDAGIHVSGAKVVATGSALTHFTFVAHHGLIPVQGKNFAVVFMVPTNAKGVKLICRVSNEMRAALLGSPFDYPLSSRLDENDAIFVMDDVFVPWEDVFVYADVEKANNFFPRTGFLPRAAVDERPRQKARARKEVVRLLDVGVDEHVFPGHEHVVHHEDRVVLVQAAGQRIVEGAAEQGRPHLVRDAADQLHALRVGRHHEHDREVLALDRNEPVVGHEGEMRQRRAGRDHLGARDVDPRVGLLGDVRADVGGAARGAGR